MNSSEKFNDTEPGSSCVHLPKPDPANITVLTPNLPNKPIIPWTHFDSPWLESEENHPEEAEEESLESTVNTQEPTNSEPKSDDESPMTPEE
ncbi:hypothetical protein [Mastigocladopsis repens]|uniref:hypothetical protein n=1 Tax=Mastigocladopsis repens TaxID=221287 RepID=UPI0002E378CE|nr:hypothetical protein [Mastigocladopsis repens]